MDVCDTPPNTLSSGLISFGFKTYYLGFTWTGYEVGSRQKGIYKGDTFVGIFLSGRVPDSRGRSTFLHSVYLLTKGFPYCLY